MSLLLARTLAFPRRQHNEKNTFHSPIQYFLTALFKKGTFCWAVNPSRQHRNACTYMLTTSFHLPINGALSTVLAALRYQNLISQRSASTLDHAQFNKSPPSPRCDNTWHLHHAIGRRVTDGWLLATVLRYACEVAAQLVRQDKLEHHSTTKVEDRSRVVQIH